MWGSNSVYNISGIETTQTDPTAIKDEGEGSGDQGFALVINGVKVFSRGANLVPFELLEATVTPGYIKRTLASVHTGNMNMLRVWGGGMYQSDVFYEECDRLGVLVYHDMMFCQRWYPHTPGFVANVKEELRYQIHRLRHHPSIVLWDSSNENEGDPAFFYDVVLTQVWF